MKSAYRKNKLKKGVVKKKTFKDKLKSGFSSLGQGSLNIVKTAGSNVAYNMKLQAETRREENEFIRKEKAKLRKQEIRAKLKAESVKRIKNPTGGNFGDSLGGFNFNL